MALTGYYREGNADDLPDNSFYMCYPGVLNLSNATQIFYVFTRRVVTTTRYVVQIATNYTTGDVYVRRGMDSGLQPWIKLN